MAAARPDRRWFLLGVFLITFAVLVLQVVQTRILSVISWYYLAFFAISVAMLGMTAGAVWVYSRRARLSADALSTRLSDSALLAAIAMPCSLLVQFSLITHPTPTLTSLFASALHMAAMGVPYFFAGITVSLALTRSPFPVSQVYGVDLLGAALGCGAVVGLLEIVDGPTAILVAGLLAAASAHAFARAAPPLEREALAHRPRWRRSGTVVLLFGVAIPVNTSLPLGFKPMLVKGNIESSERVRLERWNSYSRVIAREPDQAPPALWGPSPVFDRNRIVQQAGLNIDGSAATVMVHFDGTEQSIDFLPYDVVNLGYRVSGIHKSAVIGVGGGRDVMAAYQAGVKDITGVEVNRIFVDLLTKDPFYRSFANVMAIPGLKLRVDDARSWFAASRESFDLIQMSLIDTWAATGAGAFSLSENGLYTLEAWRAFLARLNDDGLFTVSRWYRRDDADESGRLIALAVAALLDRGVADPRQHLFVADAEIIATLILSKSPLAPARLQRLREETARLRFHVLVSPDMQPDSPVLRRLVAAKAGEARRRGPAGDHRPERADRQAPIFLQSASLQRRAQDDPPLPSWRRHSRRALGQHDSVGVPDVDPGAFVDRGMRHDRLSAARGRQDRAPQAPPHRHRLLRVDRNGLHVRRDLAVQFSACFSVTRPMRWASVCSA